MTTPSPLMYSSELDSRGSSDLFSSRSSVLRDPGLFSLSDSDLAISGDRNDSNRHFFSSDNSLISHGQDTATMFSSSSMVCYPTLLRLPSTSPKKRLGPQSSGGFPPVSPYDPGLASQVNRLREENARLRHNYELTIAQARTWK